ncbi:hypothetical protein LTR97_004885 [Elasticomyces elasticus]|uniref:Uncharacterized protein n=1 Tax=Elasticomyces elasticus TaxID=574655 RepID=A0AAN7WCH5_9PEZI|nr:hypothetical protein LTR97_004885 [Elasticomyces elasticus]
MDHPDVARMKMDLGIGRRDVVSTPQADGKGRVMRVDPRIERSIKEKDEERRARIINGAPQDLKGPEKEKAVLLAKWNTLEDASARDSGLELRCNGQGHRAQVEANVHQKQGYGPESRLGEERQMYLSRRATSGNFGGNNYVTTPRSTRAFDNQNSTPRSLPPSRSTIQPPTGPRSANVNRAPDPRAAHGVTRFVNGQRTERPATATRPRTGPSTLITQTPTKPKAPSAAPNTLASPSGVLRSFPNGVPRATTAPSLQSKPSTTFLTPSTSTATRSLVTVPAAPRLSAPKAPTMTTSPLDAATTRTTATTSAAPRLPAGLAPATTPSPLDDATTQVYLNVARDFAANPGPKCDAYYQKHPNQRFTLKQEQIRLVKAIYGMVKNPEKHEVAEYFALHKDRLWIYEECVKAGAMVEKGLIEEVDARCTDPYATSYHINKGAKHFFKAKPVTDAAPSSSVKGDTSSSAVKETEIKDVATKFEAEKRRQARLEAARKELEREEEAEEKDRLERKKRAAEKSSKPVTKSASESAVKTVDINKSAPSSNSMPGSFPREVATSAAADKPTTDNQGTLSAVFMSVAGKLVDEQSWPIKLAADLKFTIQAKSEVDVGKVIAEVERLARRLGVSGLAEARVNASIAMGMRCASAHNSKEARIVQKEDGVFEEED